MATPTFNGAALFGPSPQSKQIVQPIARWYAAYPGVNGRQSVTGGTRGVAIQVSFVLVAANEVALRALRAVFETYQATGTRATLVDTDGESWPSMALLEFVPTSHVMGGKTESSQTFIALFENND